MRKVLLALTISIVAAFSFGGSALAGGYDGYCVQQGNPLSLGATIAGNAGWFNCPGAVAANIDAIEWQAQGYVDGNYVWHTPDTTYNFNPSAGMSVWFGTTCPYPGQHTWKYKTVYRYHFAGAAPHWTAFFTVWSDGPDTHGNCA